MMLIPKKGWITSSRVSHSQKANMPLLNNYKWLAIFVYSIFFSLKMYIYVNKYNTIIE